MTAYIQSVLFEPNNIDKNDLLESISMYVLTNDMKNKYKKDDLVNDGVDNVEGEEKEDEIEGNIIEKINNREFIKPVQKDSLFWCLYICKYGFGEYTELRNNYGSKQLDIQQKATEFLKNNQTLLKNVNARITKAKVQEIMSELLVENRHISYEALYGLITYYKINIIMMHESENYFIEFLYEPCSEETDIYIIKKVQSKYVVKEDKIDLKDYEKLKEEKYCFPNYNTPIKSMTTYKMLDLELIANKLDIEVDSKVKKNELYEKIRCSICWD